MSFDWNQVRTFLATVEEGSLSAAARALGQTQPTVSRQISALETSLGMVLFKRGHRTTTLTQSGLILLDHVRAMGEAANQISLTASGQSQMLEGPVAITATDAMSAYILPAILQEVRTQAPNITLELITSNEVRDLNKREADIAIRHAKPEREDLISKCVHETTAYLYAATSYLDVKGRPKDICELSDLDFVGFETPEHLLITLNSLGLNLSRKNFKMTATSGLVMFELIKQGFGVGIMPKPYAEKDLNLEYALQGLDPVIVPIWLVTHRELYNNRRIRFVFDMLVDSFI